MTSHQPRCKSNIALAQPLVKDVQKTYQWSYICSPALQTFAVYVDFYTSLAESEMCLGVQMVCKQKCKWHPIFLSAGEVSIFAHLFNITVAVLLVFLFVFFFWQLMHIGIRKANIHNLHVWLKSKYENMLKIFLSARSVWKQFRSSSEKQFSWGKWK